MYTREMGTICPFGVFSPVLQYFLLQNWPVFWELEKAIIGAEKDKWWIWGSKTPKPPEMPIKLGKTSQHHNWPRYMDWPQIGPKIAIKQGKNAKRTNGTYCRDQNDSGSGKKFPGTNFQNFTDFIAGQALSGIDYRFQ